MMITDEHMEWVTVHRMGDMLVNVHDEYKVTRTYALFTTILCWVMQRVRINGHEEIDRKAHAVLTTLENEPVSNLPWGIVTAEGVQREQVVGIFRHGPFVDFQGFSAARFLIALRNAVAHGDARSIRPVNRGNILVGHEFRCSEQEHRRVTWRGRIILERRDMRRIGVALANRFCDALADRGNDNHRAYFRDDAQTIAEEAA